MKQSYDAVVILGAARSGTKFLRSLLAVVPGFATVPYDSNHVWRIGNETVPHDVLDSASLSQRRAAAIRDSLWRLGESIGDRRVLVEKTVSNALRLPYVADVFPAARYLHIVRDGRDAIESTYRMWKAPPDRHGLMRKLRSLPLRALPYAAWYAGNMALGKLRGRGVNVWGVRYPGIVEDIAAQPLELVCAKQWLSCIQTMDRDLAERPGLSVLEIRYETLVSDPRQIERIAEFLGLDLDALDAMRKRYRAELQAPSGSRWTETFDAATRQRLEPLVDPARARLGYGCPATCKAPREIHG